MTLKQLEWVGSSKKDLMKFPDEIQRFMGHALHAAQQDRKHKSIKILKGFGGASVLEIIDMDEHGTFRVVYTIKYDDAIYVLHAFQKKSKQGIKTPKEEIDKIKARLKMAEQISILKKKVHR